MRWESLPKAVNWVWKAKPTQPPLERELAAERGTHEQRERKDEERELNREEEEQNDEIKREMQTVVVVVVEMNSDGKRRSWVRESWTKEGDDSEEQWKGGERKGQKIVAVELMSAVIGGEKSREETSVNH